MFWRIYMKTAFSSQRRYSTTLFVITNMAAVTLRVNQQCKSFEYEQCHIPNCFLWRKLNNSQDCRWNNVGICCVRLHVAKSLTTFKANKKTGHFLSWENTKPICLKTGLLPSQKNWLRQVKNSNSDHLIYIYWVFQKFVPIFSSLKFHWFLLIF